MINKIINELFDELKNDKNIDLEIDFNEFKNRFIEYYNDLDNEDLIYEMFSIDLDNNNFNGIKYK